MSVDGATTAVFSLSVKLVAFLDGQHVFLLQTWLSMLVLLALVLSNQCPRQMVSPVTLQLPPSLSLSLS